MGAAHSAIKSAVATSTTISSSLSRGYGPVLSILTYKGFLDQRRVRSAFRVYFSPSRYEVFVSTEDAASGIVLPDMQKGLERKRNIGSQSNF